MRLEKNKKSYFSKAEEKTFCFTKFSLLFGLEAQEGFITVSIYYTLTVDSSSWMLNLETFQALRVYCPHKQKRVRIFLLFCSLEEKPEGYATKIDIAWLKLYHKRRPKRKGQIEAFWSLIQRCLFQRKGQIKAFWSQIRRRLFQRNSLVMNWPTFIYGLWIFTDSAFMDRTKNHEAKGN